MIKGLFLYNPSDLNSDIPGGVQICSQEFLKVLKLATDELIHFEVNFSKDLFFRFLFKLNLDNYLSYKVASYTSELINTINTNQITHVFINKSELIRFSKIIKIKCPHVKIIIMSHGNESGDLLHNLSGKSPSFLGIKKIFGKLKLGLAIYTESYYRIRYVDLVCVMSEEEAAIEKWLGQNNPFYIPRLINKNVISIKTKRNKIFGYVGTLDHNPNYIALKDLFNSLKNINFDGTIHLVGQPKKFGEELALQYNFVKYLGALSNDELNKEVGNWGFFINPIFHYSRGASMKLAKAIEWEIPTITTIAGSRGYQFDKKLIKETNNNAIAFAQAIEDHLNVSDTSYEELKQNISSLKQNGISVSQISSLLREELTKLR